MVCEPNAAQLAAWADEEADSYLLFYMFLGAVSAVIWLVALGLACRMAPEGFSRSDCQWRVFQLIGGFMVWVRCLDFMTDWAFYCLSVQAPRFVYVMEREGLSQPDFAVACLAFCILSAVGFLPDMYSFYQKRIALGADLAPPPETAWIALGLILVEDVPQLVLGSIYIHVMTKVNRELPEKYQEPLDPVAIISLTMSVLGLLANLALTLAPKLVFKMVDEKTGERRPSARASSIKGAQRKAGVVANPTYTEGAFN